MPDEGFSNLEKDLSAVTDQVRLLGLVAFGEDLTSDSDFAKTVVGHFT